MAVSPFRLTVYDKAFNRRGTIGAPLHVKWRPVHNGQSSATVTLAADHPRAVDLMTRGGRLAVEYDGKVIGGPVFRRSAVGPAARATLTVEVHDDWRLLTRILGWPVPTAGVGGQVDAYYTRRGPCETVVKDIVAANAARLGLPVTVAPTQGRGGTVTASMRFHPLADRLVPLMDTAGIGLTVRQQGTGFLVDAYAVQQYPRTLTERSGVVRSWEWVEDNPTATRAVAGAAGEAEARAFYGPVVDAALEAEYGDVVEVFADARNAGDDPVTAQADATKSMQQKLADGRPQAGLKVALAETDTFRYGRAVNVGDRVRLEVGPGIVIDDVLREAELEWTAANGLTVNPVIGDRAGDTDRMFTRALAALGRGLRDLAGR